MSFKVGGGRCGNVCFYRACDSGWATFFRSSKFRKFDQRFFVSIFCVKLSINNHIVGLVHKKHILGTCLKYHAACKVEFTTICSFVEGRDASTHTAAPCNGTCTPASQSQQTRKEHCTLHTKPVRLDYKTAPSTYKFTRYQAPYRIHTTAVNSLVYVLKYQVSGTYWWS